MIVGRVIGQVVATVKDANLAGLRIFVVQPLDAQLRPAGKPLAAVDGIRCAGVGDVVYLATKRDAAIALGDKPPVDATIIGYVDESAVEREPGGRVEPWRP
ncbi:MAG: EutN/CcmL family microcompartment protein [Myxococcales bacterium]|nr:EutN/CcmL family microcompartment protein [Myxococcales bacterium]